MYDTFEQNCQTQDFFPLSSQLMNPPERPTIIMWSKTIKFSKQDHEHLVKKGL